MIDVNIDNGIFILLSFIKIICQDCGGGSDGGSGSGDQIFDNI